MGNDYPNAYRIRLRNGGVYVLGETGIERLEKKFRLSKAEVHTQLMLLTAWNEDNEEKRKTVKGIHKHINFWFSSYVMRKFESGQSTTQPDYNPEETKSENVKNRMAEHPAYRDRTITTPEELKNRIKDRGW